MCLQASVLKALKRLEDVHEMFEKRHVSLKRLSAKQTRPVQHVAPRPESSPKQPSAKSGQRTVGSQQGEHWPEPSGPRWDARGHSLGLLSSSFGSQSF